MTHTTSGGAPRSRYLTGGGVAVLVVTLLGLGAWRSADVKAAPDGQSVISPAPSASAAPTASYANVVEKVAPAVVTIRTERKATIMPTAGQLPPELGELFGRRFMLPQQRGPEAGLGSGVVVTTDGYILTNNHVIEEADEIHVEMPDRRTFDAALVGADPASDLAVLRIKASNLTVLPLGDSDHVRVGDIVLAVGNPLGVGQTVTMGIISGKGRQTSVGDGSFENFLQTDAPINRGNSGGALVNLNGELVGINSQILSPSGGNIGVGFAIPANMARNVMGQLIKTGTVHRAKLGVAVQPITGDLAASLGLGRVSGALVSNVEDGGPAARAGLQRGDVILAVNGHEVADSNALRNEVAGMTPGSHASIAVLRDGQKLTLNATLAELEIATPANGENGERSSKGRYGLRVEPMTPDLADRLQVPRGTKGVAVVDVDPMGAAAEAGLREGDVIQQVNGSAVQSGTDLKEALDAATSRPALLLVQREGRNLFLALRAPQA
jgi:Do/DeqQ family serine protease